ncbi:hypothetical protein [Polynucleobacter sp. Adler-ghost]|uniref:hypothetical protein n=1 Tax=Polynucleobacter sp. Adler-ghost TaxID=2770234 RepID=UPI001BFE0CCE|nr:hypothetical protein [Polynucleobacter sp. Adler-ghost]QWE30735.1 hypothetical protein ICV89_10785 [Polynucleobacter sp. Adler-ghost]
MKTYKNYLIATALALAAFLVLKFPMLFSLSGDVAAAASLCGALIAAAAIFVGNQININATNDLRAEEREQERESIRCLLMSEIVPIFIRHVKEAKQYIDLCQFITQGGQAVVPWSGHYQILEASIYHSLIKELIKLPAKEADALVTLYSQMVDTQKGLDSLIGLNLGQINHSTALKLANQLSADCEAAAKVVQLIAPKRQIKLVNGKVINFVELLKDPSLFG